MAEIEGVGSTIVLIECHGCDPKIAGSPLKLHVVMRGLIVYAGLTVRDESLDVWESPKSGPATSYHTLSESHVRAFTIQASQSFVRSESWTEPQHEFYVGADFQVCNYSQDNRDVPKRMALKLAELLGAREYQYMVIQRGPGMPLRVITEPTLRRCR